MLRSEGPLTDNAFIIPSVTWYVQASSSKQPPKFLNLFYHTLEGAEGRGGEEMLKNLSAKQALAKSSLGIILSRCPDCVQQWKENADCSQKATSMSEAGPDGPGTFPEGERKN